MARKKQQRPRQQKVRNREPSDTARVIRKRFEDEAKRYERQAAKAGKAEARYLNQAAEAARANAEKYKLANLREKFGKGDAGTLKIMEYLDTVGRQESERGMYKNLRSQNAREQRLAERVLSGSGGSAFYAGTVQIWRGKTGDERNQAILDFFGKENMWQVLQHLEQQLGVNFFDIKELKAEMYSIEALQIMEHVVQQMAV